MKNVYHLFTITWDETPMGETSGTIIIDPNNVYKKTYRIRMTGKNGASIETTIPKIVFEKEAKRRGLTVEEAAERLMVEWRYNNFHGMHMVFIDRPKKKTPKR